MKRKAKYLSLILFSSMSLLTTQTYGEEQTYSSYSSYSSYSYSSQSGASEKSVTESSSSALKIYTRPVQQNTTKTTEQKKSASIKSNPQEQQLVVEWNNDSSDKSKASVIIRLNGKVLQPEPGKQQVVINPSDLKSGSNHLKVSVKDAQGNNISVMERVFTKDSLTVSPTLTTTKMETKTSNAH